MDKIKNADWIFLAILMLSIRSAIDFSFPQAVALIALVGYKAYQKYLETKTSQNLNEEVMHQLTEMKTTVSGLAMKNAAKPAAMAQEIKRFF